MKLYEVEYWVAGDYSEDDGFESVIEHVCEKHLTSLLQEIEKNGDYYDYNATNDPLEHCWRCYKERK
jgi:hypothetical protein